MSIANMPHTDVSTGRARRLRNSATKRRLYENSKIPSCSVQQPAASELKMDSLLEHMQQLIFSVQCVLAFSQNWYSYIGGCERSPSFADAGVPGHVLSQQCNAARAIQRKFRQWQAVQPKSYSQMSELQKSAITVQKLWRGHVVRSHWIGRASNGASVSDEESESNGIASCFKCNGPVDLESDDADRCDTCGAFGHAECLNTCLDLKGEWRLCSTCVDDPARRQSTIVGDFRRLPSQWWSELYRHFIHVEADTSHHVPSDSVIDPAATSRDATTHCIFSQLDSTLDFTLKFLEGHHAKSASIDEATKDTVMKLIKSAMSWRNTSRTQSEVEEYTKKFNSLMCEIVAKL